MSRLQGVANAIRDGFLNRYNDIDGYWAMGVIVAQFDEHSESTCELSIWPEPDVQPAPLAKELAPLARHWSNGLAYFLAAYEVEPARIRVAGIQLVIDREASARITINRQETTGYRYTLRVCFGLHDGWQVVSTGSGWCAPHSDLELGAVRMPLSQRSWENRHQAGMMSW